MREPPTHGPPGGRTTDPAVVDWLVLDRQLLNDRDQRLVDRLLQSQFTVRYDTDGILVAERTAPGPAVSTE